MKNELETIEHIIDDFIFDVEDAASAEKFGRLKAADLIDTLSMYGYGIINLDNGAITHADNEPVELDVRINRENKN